MMFQKREYDQRFSCESTITVDKDILPLYYYTKEHEELVKKLRNPRFKWGVKYLSGVPHLQHIADAEYIRGYMRTNPSFGQALRKALEEADYSEPPPKPYYYVCTPRRARSTGSATRKNYKKHVLSAIVREECDYIN